MQTNAFKDAVPLPFDPFYKSYNNIRRLKVIVLSDKLSKYKQFKILPYEKKIEILTSIENSCLNEALRKAREYAVRCIWDNDNFTNIYHTICYNIISNIDNQFGSDTLINKILAEEINLNTIAHLTCKELCPERYEVLSSEINKRSKIEQSVKYSEMFFCKKCKHNQTTVERVQIRSADEACNLRITCLYCDNQWIK